MTLTEALKHDLTAAMKAGDRARVGALRMVLSELQRAAKDGGGDELAVLRRERKRRLESARAFRDGGRPELARGEEQEAALIDTYLPAQLDDAELREIVVGAIADSGAVGPSAMGKVMGLAMAAVDGRADGGRVSDQVRRTLAGG